jgi:hypothetical protein
LLVIAAALFFKLKLTKNNNDVYELKTKNNKKIKRYFLDANF